MKYGALISFSEDQKKIIEVHFDNMVANYSYSLDFIKQNNDDFNIFSIEFPNSLIILL
jgi:hypothetical protein